MEAAGYAEDIESFNKILDNFCKDLERFILDFNSSILGSFGFVPAIASDDVLPQNNMPNTEYLRVLNAHFKKKSETGTSGSKTGNSTPF